MKNKLHPWVKRCLPRTLVAFLYSIGLCMPLISTFDLPVSMGSVVFSCALFCLMLFLLSYNKLTSIIGSIACISICGVYVSVNSSSFVGIFRAITIASQTSILTQLQIYAVPLTLGFCFVFSMISYFLSYYDAAAFFPALSLALCEVLLLVSYSPDINPLLLLPALVALLMLFARSARWEVDFSSSFATVAVSTLLCLALLPSAGILSPTLKSIADRFRDVVTDYFFFTDPRTVFSLQLSGYQPLGSERLGGAINPGDDPVMEVETAHTVLLRGVIKNEYTGQVWKDTTSARRYLYINPRFWGIRSSLFDMNRPSEESLVAHTLLSEQTIDVTLKMGGTSTLFVPQRLMSIAPGENMVPYFGNSSEVFITRDTKRDDQYSLTAAVFTGDSPELESLLRQSNAYPDPNYEDVAAVYTAVSPLVEESVRQLANTVTAQANSPYAQARLLTDFLRETYPYTYDQNTPSPDRDFVSWFLLSEKQGYCTSFASALAVMGRIVGLPTRYVEGYVAKPGADGVAYVTQKQAHAWTEVYFSGFGWVAFDPTPGTDFADESESDGESGEQDSADESGADADEQGEPGATPTPPPSSSQDGEPTPTPPDDGGSNQDETPTPSPEPSPTPSPPPDDDKDPNATPTPTPSPTPLPSPTPTLPPDQTPSPSPSPSPPPDEPDKPNFPYHILLLILLLLLLIALIAWRIWATNPANMCKRVRTTSTMLLIYYRAILLALSCMGHERIPSESPIAHASRAQEMLPDEELIDLHHMAQTVCVQQYGRHTVSNDDLNIVIQTYTQLLTKMKRTQRIKMLALRCIRGLGSLREIT